MINVAAAAAPAIGEDGEVLSGVADEEAEEDDNAEASDEEVAAAQASPRSVMPSSPDMDGDHGIRGSAASVTTCSIARTS